MGDDVRSEKLFSQYINKILELDDLEFISLLSKRRIISLSYNVTDYYGNRDITKIENRYNNIDEEIKKVYIQNIEDSR